MATNHSDDDEGPTDVPSNLSDGNISNLRKRINEHSSTSTSKPSPDGNNNKKDKKLSPKSENSPTQVISKSNAELKNEYINSLNGWMAACTYWRMYHTMLQSTFMSSQFPVTTSRINGTSTVPNSRPNSSDGSSSGSDSDTTSPSDGTIYKIPDIWKRATAELIDFFLLLLMKILVTYVAIDFLDLIDLSKFDFSSIDFEEMDTYQFAMDITSEILVIETVHRFIVIIFETIFLMRNLAFREDCGGSTPGKKIMGLRVVSCTEIQELPGDRIKVTPAGDIGIGFSLLRALIKNFSSIFFLPASLTVFVSVHNRAAYDIACRCIVVEDVNDFARVRRR